MEGIYFTISENFVEKYLVVTKIRAKKDEIRTFRFCKYLSEILIFLLEIFTFLWKVYIELSVKISSKNIQWFLRYERKR